MRRLAGPVVAAVCALLCAGQARAAATVSGDNGPWIAALSTAFVVMDLSTGDLDGDGKDETAVCYREDVTRTEQVAGIAVYAGKGAEARPVFHVQLDEALCEKVRINGRKLAIQLNGSKQLTWTYGVEVKFRAQGLKASASSSSDASHGADKAIDGDLMSSWAEGTEGTGLGQTVTIKLPRPTDIGMIGIFGGNGSATRSYFDNNRIHRASLAVKTEAEAGDAAAGLDFASLGIEALGERQEFTCENKPQVTYVHVGRKGVVELQFRVESVYLGDKRDDTQIAEIEVVPTLSLRETVDRATSMKPVDDDKKKAQDKKSDAPNLDESLKKLDESGGSLIGDDNL